MTDPLTITIDDAAVQAAFRRLMEFGRDPSPMMAEIAEHLLESTQRRFDTGTDPDGSPWVPLKDGSGRTPLRDTGTLRDQIFPGYGSDFAQITAATKLDHSSSPWSAPSVPSTHACRYDVYSEWAADRSGRCRADPDLAALVVKSAFDRHQGRLRRW